MTMALSIQHADITALDVDAIVNAANAQLLGGGGVDGAIHRAAGSRLLEACRAIPEVRPGVRCPTGEARITPGFELPARFVIHTVGPVWQGGHAREDQLLANCYQTSLELAEANAARSIAFPAISCGVYGFPVERASAIAVREVRRHLERARSVSSVILVAFDARMLRVLQESVRLNRVADR